MNKAKDVLEGARTILPYLAELLEASQAAEINKKLIELLAQSQIGKKVDYRILELLASHEATRTWMAAFLELDLPPEVDRFYSPAPGSMGPVSCLSEFVCPQGDYVWSRRSIGEPIPQCPTHQLDLVLSDPAQAKGSS